MATKQNPNETIENLMASVSGTLEYLYVRWQDEREYEDFADYADAMRKALGADHTFVRATKRPFGMVVRPSGFPFDVQIFINSTSFGYKRV